MDADEKLLEERRIAIEERKLAIEEEKLALAQRQYELEKQKSPWTKYSVLATVVIAAGTIWYSLYSLNATARSQFAVKTAELIFATQDAGQMIAKGRVMADFYGNELPPGFAAKLQDKTLLDDLAKLYPDPHMESKIELLKEIVAHPEQHDDILLRWQWMFPDDKPFLDEYRAARAKDKGK